MKKGAFVVACIVLIGGMLASINHAYAAKRFSDIGTSHRASAEIDYLAQGEIVQGDNSGKFFPDRYVTRAEAAAIIGRTLNFNGTQRSTDFTDVGMKHFASGYIQEAVSRNIIKGYTDGSFKPNNFVTRGEMALLISRAYAFNANSVSAAIQSLITKGIAQGMANGTFGKDEPIKRADFAVFVTRAVHPKYRINYQMTTIQKSSVKATALNVRKGPSTTYDVIGKLLNGQAVDVLHKIGDWVYVKSGDLEGFVHRDYLNGIVSNNPPQQSPTDTLQEYLKTQTIIIDPGHGGTDPGAVSNGLKEKDITLSVALELKALFEGTGFNIALTRETDKTLTLNERVAFAKQKSGNVFVSIHTNAFNGKANGTETYYYGAAATNPHVEKSKKLAEFIQKRMIEAWNLYNRGVKSGNFHVLRENNMPAALAELGFIDHQGDAEKLKSPYWQKQAAKAIYLGILDYYQHYNQPISFQSLYNRVN